MYFDAFSWESIASWNFFKDFYAKPRQSKDNATYYININCILIFILRMMAIKNNKLHLMNAYHYTHDKFI